MASDSRMVAWGGGKADRGRFGGVISSHAETSCSTASKSQLTLLYFSLELDLERNKGRSKQNKDSTIYTITR